MQSQEKQNLFMASISHELRTPLTSILGYGELLQDTSLDKKQQEYLGRMLHSSKYLLSLVGDFLDIVKFEKNDISLDNKEVCLHTILTECADIIKTNLHKDTILKTDIPFLEYSIVADSRRIKQVILNILSNAVKFTKKGEIHFYVKGVEDMGSSVKIRVNIEDSGIGMSTEMQKALFNPFITADSTQGFGLGLFISKEIIKLMDGDISIVSHEREGSQFSVTFVARKGNQKELSKKLYGKKLLLISNDDTLQEHIDDLIKTFNTIFEYESPNRDVSDTLNDIFINARSYNVILFDMNEIEYDVTNMISTLRVINPSIFCIALLNNNRVMNTSSFDSIINTPITARDLIFQIEEFFVKTSNKNSSVINFSNLRVLVVEDVEMNRKYIKEMLSISFSISCDTAQNGQEAVEKAREKEYDIIFMDIRMPVMNGYDATKQIRAFNKDILIICMSADVYERDIKAAKESGMDAFIEKPLDKDELKQCFLNYMNGGIKNIDHKLSRIKKNKEILENSSVEKEQQNIEDMRTTSYNHLIKVFDDEIVKGLLGKAIESIDLYIEEIGVNTVKKDSNALANNFHALKGVLVNLGLNDEANIASKIQNLFRENHWSKAIEKKEKFMKIMIDFSLELKNERGDN